MTKEELKQMIESEIKNLLTKPGQPTPQVSARPTGFGPKGEGGGSRPFRRCRYLGHRVRLYAVFNCW